MSTHFLCSHSSSPLPALGSGSGAIRTGPFQEYSFWANAAFSRHSSTRAVEKNVKEINQLRKRKRYLLDTCFVCKRRLTSHADTKWWQFHEWMKGKRDWWAQQESWIYIFHSAPPLLPSNFDNAPCWVFSLSFLPVQLIKLYHHHLISALKITQKQVHTLTLRLCCGCRWGVIYHLERGVSVFSLADKV